MGKPVFALLIGFLLTQNAFSYSIIADSNLFYSLFEEPQNVIEFKRLKDGTPIGNFSKSLQIYPMDRANPDCSVTDKAEIGSGRILVRSNAFSDNWSFMVANNKEPDKFCEAIIWFDQGISSGNNKLTVVAASGRSKPFVLYTNKGFLGVIPDNPEETVFKFDSFSVVFSFETDFLKHSSTMESFVAKSKTD